MAAWKRYWLLSGSVHLAVLIFLLSTGSVTPIGKTPPSYLPTYLFDQKPVLKEQSNVFNDSVKFSTNNSFDKKITQSTTYNATIADKAVTSTSRGVFIVPRRESYQESATPLAQISRTTASGEDAWLAALHNAIAQHQYYPPLALLHHQQGRVTVTLCVDRRGGLTRASIQESSHYRELDQAALDAINRTFPLTDIPQKREGCVLTPIDFSIK